MIKLYLKEIPHRCGIILDAYLNIGNIYEGELCPVIYDPYKSSPGNLQPVPPSYIIKCNDGKLRKVDASFFLTSEEMRNEKLNELGI
jgi:hypothetical protein